MDKIRRKNASRVICAMSGGIDSSVAAALLKRAGFDVIGVFMKFWTESKKGELVGFNKCCSAAAERRARRVAKMLKIPFYVFNFEKEFKKRVVDYFLKEYKRSLTPNPCVVCNKEIKFGFLLEKARDLNADFVATGHYARLEFLAQNYRLLKGKDKEKDQSYFLWQLNQKKLKHILFPVGNYTKVQVRKLAKKFALPVLNIPESQEICFIPGSVDNFLKRYIKEKPGNIVNKERKVLGRHQGLWFYTIGQRKGIGLAGGPYFVLNKDLKKNLLIVTKNQKDLLKKELSVKDVNWISGKNPKLPTKVKVKIRYRHEASPAKIYKLSNAKYKILFNQPQRSITPGQSAVFYNAEGDISGRTRYKGQELLGGGIIC